MSKSLYIIDGHAHIYAAYFAPMRGQLTSPSGEATKATYIFTMAVLGLIENYRPDMLVVAMDSKERSFRAKVYPEYKAHRPPMPEDMPRQIERIEEIMEAMRIPVLRVPQFEADDVIGTLAKQASAKGIDAYICSKDKDMLQLLNEHVFVFDMKTGERTDGEKMRAEMKVGPEQFVDVLALSGDASDNVPGVADVGLKTALAWIQEYGSIEKLYEHADEIKGKRGDSLRNSKEIVALSRELVTINCDAPVEIDETTFSLKEPDVERLAALYRELGFSRLLSQLGQAGGEHEKTEQDSKKEGGGVGSAKTVEHEYKLVDTAEGFERFVGDLKKQKLFAVDTETTAVDAMRADLVGMSFCWEAHKAYYLPLKGALGSRHLDIGRVRKELGPILADEKVRKVGQNIKYDMLILRNAQMPLGGIYFDTMVAAYCLDPERASNSMDALAMDFLNYEPIPISALIGKGRNQLTFDMVDTGAACEYSAEDADVTFQLYECLRGRLEKQAGIRKLFEEVEMPLVSVLTEMEYNGVSLDVGVLKRMSGEIAAEIKKLSEKIYKEAGTVFNIDSPKQLGEVLFDRLGLVSTEVGKTGRSTSAGVLEQLSEFHPIAELVLQYRQLTKLHNTYTDKLGALINPRTNRVHASFNQTVTATGRLSSSDPNLQNIPIRTELGRKIRSAFVPASEGDYILSADYSQIELRLLAHFSKDKALTKAFEEDRDIHSFVASQVYGVPIEEVTGEMRSSCKAVNFGIIYGQGAFGLSRTTGMSQAEAKKFIEDYFARYSSIRQFMDGVFERARRNGYAETILGRRRKIANASSRNAAKRNQARRLAVNTVIQGSAADLIKAAMINIQRKIDREKPAVKMILQVHDELVFEVKAAEAEQHSEWIRKMMREAIELDVPLKVDVEYGQTWLGDK